MSLYIVANLARLRAWVLVARKMRAAFSRTLYAIFISADMAGGGGKTVRTFQTGRAQSFFSSLSVEASFQRGVALWRIHERMWKPDFGAVNGAVAGSLDDGEDVMVIWVENNALSSRLHGIFVSQDSYQRSWDWGPGGGVRGAP